MALSVFCALSCSFMCVECAHALHVAPPSLDHHRRRRRPQDFFGPMIVDAVECLGPSLDLSLIGIKKVSGGSVTESMLVKGVAFKRTFSYAGFEQQPKSFDSPKILLLNLELELKSEKENAEIRLEDVDAYQSIVDAEWSIIYDKLAACAGSGAQIILSKLPIGDLATQYFADRGLFCAGRVARDDLERVARATGARVQTTVNGLTPDVLGTCEKFEEVQVRRRAWRAAAVVSCESAEMWPPSLHGLLSPSVPAQLGRRWAPSATTSSRASRAPPRAARR
jgi:hypothetical protein